MRNPIFAAFSQNLRYALAPVLALALAACGQAKDPTAAASTGPDKAAPPETAAAAPKPAEPLTASSGLTARLDCVRKAEGVLLIGHRGGPNRDYPENALETLERTYKAGTHGGEIDVTASKDGVLFLNHDQTLDYGTTGKGPAADKTWAEISKLKLRTATKVTPYSPARLDDVLQWAVANHAVLELDHKDASVFDGMFAAVRAAKAENNVFIITYTDDEAALVAKKAPDLVMTATVNSTAQADDLLRRGVTIDHLVAWTGVTDPNPDLWKALSARGIESAFGTLGPKDKSLDTKYWADKDGGEYDDLVEKDGLSILVTDLTDKVARELAAPMKKAEACGF